MKQIFIFLLFSMFCYSNIANAQNNYDQGTTWHYGFIREVIPIYNQYLSQILTINGDTVIEGQSFQRIIKSEGSHNWDIQTPFSVEYIKKENDKVYWFNQQNGKISILYDFAAEQGESWTISINNCELLVVVDSVNYSEYDGVIKKNLYVSDYLTDWEGREYVGICFKGKIIKDIGHTVTYFPHRAFNLCEGLHVSGILIDNIRCYEDHNLYHNFKGYLCDTIWTESLIGISVFEKINIRIYPNPVTEILTIETSDITDVSITNIAGRIVCEKYIYEPTTYFDTSKWKTGIYFVSFFSRGVRIKTEKLIKSER
ncbi:MAG: T9SS type A sorting domain-containing protein [Spirochaetaceae bacterium]|nr:T9SS type A sorting domain-containing protein [Spirochaetaceae bacterium]